MLEVLRSGPGVVEGGWECFEGVVARLAGEGSVRPDVLADVVSAERHLAARERWASFAINATNAATAETWRRSRPASSRYDDVVAVTVSVAGLDRLRDVCARYGVARLEVFGSVARGDDSADSDIDLLYSLEPGTRLGWRIEDLAEELGGILGRPVDLVARNALHERLRDAVLAEAQLLYAA